MLSMTSSRVLNNSSMTPSPTCRANGAMQEQSSGEDEDDQEMECPSFVRDRTIMRTLHDFEEDNDVGMGPGLIGGAGEADFVSWDAKTISQHLVKYLDDLCGWVPDPKVQYRRVASNSHNKTTAGSRTSGTGAAGSKITSRADLEAQVRRLSVTNSRVTSRMKTMTMEFEFRHYHNPKKYMEQYRRFHTCGGPLEKLATQDASYGRKRSIYYAGNASAEAGFVKPEPAKPAESRLAAVAAQQARLVQSADNQRLSPSRLRRNSETKSDSPSRLDSGNGPAAANSATSRTTSAVQAAASPTNVEQTTTTTLPRYCTLTEAAMRKRQTYAPWSHIPQHTAKDADRGTALVNGGNATLKSSRDSSVSEHLPPTSIPSSLSVVDKDAAASGLHVVKTQSWNPAGLRPTTTAGITNNGFRPSLHQHATASSSTTLPSTAANDPYAIRPAGPPVGQHPFWKPNTGSTQSSSTSSDNHFPATFGCVEQLNKNTLLKAIDEELSVSDQDEGTSMCPNPSNGTSCDGGYSYRSESAMTSSEGSAFRDFYSHLLQAAHYLRLAGRQRKSEHAHSAISRPYNKSSKAPGEESNLMASAFADPIPVSLNVAHGLGIRGQRLNSATHSSSGLARAVHSAAPALDAGGDGGGMQRKFISASAFKARFNASTQQDSSSATDQTPNSFQRKKYISLEPPPAYSLGKDLSAAATTSTTSAASAAARRGSSESNMAGGDEQAKGKVYQISIPNKPCAADANPVNKAALCQAVCIQSDSKEAVILGERSPPGR